MEQLAYPGKDGEPNFALYTLLITVVPPPKATTARPYNKHNVYNLVVIKMK